MSTFLIVLAWLAIFHFVYEGIIAPAARIRLRNQLFVTRDQLRQAKIDGVAEGDEEVFWQVHDGVNFFLSRLPHLTVTTQVSATEAYRRDAKLAAVVDERIARVAKCQDARLTGARDKTVAVMLEAYVCNSGGWTVYVLPVALFFVAYSKLKRLVTSLILTPEAQTAKLLSEQPC
jgi:hypothetical protein